MSSSSQNILDTDPFGRFTNTPEHKVIVLWDYENCPVPRGVSGLSAIRNIREAALKFGSIDQFEAYCDWSDKASNNIKNDLSISGVKVRDCPKKGWISTVGKAIVVDMMVYALERPQTTTILLISGDKDHDYAISTLRNRGYPVKLLAPTGTLHSGLQALADLLNWNSIFKSDPLPAELVVSRLAGGEEDETEEEGEEMSEEEEDEEEDADADADTEGDSEEEMETEETAQVQVGWTTVADETAQVQVGVKSGAEETVKLQVETERKVQVLVETDDEAWDSGEPALRGTPPQSEFVATLAPAEIPPLWTPAEPALSSKVVPLELLSARAQEQEERPRSSPLPSPSPPTWSQTVPSSHVGESSQLGFGASFTQQPQTVPPNYVGWSSQPRSWGSTIQPPQTVPPSYSGGSGQPGIGASASQQPQTASPSYGGGSSQLGFGASVVQHRGRDVPRKFLPLVQELEAIKAAGSPAPKWAQLGGRVKQRLPSVLSDAGVNKWSAYLLLAEKEGVVELQRRQPNSIGGMKVILRTVAPSYGGGNIQPKFGASFIQQRQTVPPSSGGGSSQHGIEASSIRQPWTVPPNYGGGSTQPGFGTSFNPQRQTVPPSFGGERNQPRFGASSIQQPQTASPSYGGESSQPEFGASVVQHRARDVPTKFLVLVQELEAIKAKGSPAPKSGQLRKLVKQRLPSFLSDASVKSWKRYLLLAETKGIIEIMRHPDKPNKLGKSKISLKI